MTDAEIKKQLRALAVEHDAFCLELQARAKAIVGDRKVRIVSDWNGQPHGVSRRSRKGEVLDVDRICCSMGPSWVYVTTVKYPYDSDPELRDVEFIEG